MYNKEILKAIQAGLITKKEGARLLIQFKNINVALWTMETEQDKEFFKLCQKAGLDFPQIVWVD